MQGSALLYVKIVDYDRLSSNDLVDNIYIPIHLNPGQSITRHIFEGIYRRSRFELSIDLSCQPNFYGEDCLTNCIPTDNDSGHFGCGPQGERLCLPGWKDPGNDCLTRKQFTTLRITVACKVIHVTFVLVAICEECNPIGGRCTTPHNCR